MKGRNVSLNNIPNMYKQLDQVSVGEAGNSAARTGSLCVKVFVCQIVVADFGCYDIKPKQIWQNKNRFIQLSVFT